MSLPTISVFFRPPDHTLFPDCAGFSTDLERVLGDHLPLSTCMAASLVSKNFCRVQRSIALSKCDHMQVTFDAFRVVDTCDLSQASVRVPASERSLTLNWTGSPVATTVASMWGRAQEMLTAMRSAGPAPVTTLTLKCPRGLVQEALERVPSLSCCGDLHTLIVIALLPKRNVYTPSKPRVAVALSVRLPGVHTFKMKNVSVSAVEIVDSFPNLAALHLTYCDVSPCCSLTALRSLVELRLDNSGPSNDPEGPASPLLQLLEGGRIKVLSIAHIPELTTAQRVPVISYVASSVCRGHPAWQEIHHSQHGLGLAMA